jgi:putative aldouronate transport system substrate-binding protein
MIDPGFGVMDASKVAELTTTGHAGIVYGAQWNAIWPLQFNKNADPKAQWQALPIVTATGHEALVQSSTVTNKWTVVKKGAEHPEAVVKMYNLYIDTNWGENNQNSVYYAPIDSESIWKLSPICPEMPNKNIDAFLQLEDARKSCDTSHIKGKALSIQNKLDLFAQGSKEGFALWGWERVYGSEGAYSIYRDYLNSGRIVSDRYTAAPTETMSDFLSTLKAMQNEVFTKIILGDAPIESFDRFVSDFYALGGQRITDEVNSWYRLQTSQ